MIEIKTNKELKKAIFCKDDVIHVDDKNLTAGIITRPHKHKRLLTWMKIKGYRMVAAKCFGVFDVRFVKTDRSNS